MQLKSGSAASKERRSLKDKHSQSPTGNEAKSTEVDWIFLAIFSHLQMTLAMRREFQFPADKRFHVKLTPMDDDK
ncbi:hypothetical protein [Nostoc sp.]|uniref:hypothetical protein n=1 Tax=Nostoc sp. TaxID=1180 RepID=UPI002FF4B83A